MLIENAEFGLEDRLPKEHQGAIFRNCKFEGLNIDGFYFEGTLLSCRMTGADLYWSLFNTVLAADTTFENCLFRGASFAGCAFTKCRFKNCRFVKDNLGAECTFSECTMTECSFISCEFDREKRNKKKAANTSRFYGCSMEDCHGFQGLW